MKDVAPIVVLNPLEGFQEPPNGHMVVKDFGIDICGEPIHLQIGIRDQQATLVDMIPVARSIVSQTVRIALKQIHKTGSTIPCGQGCSACCSHLIPLAIPEAVYLAEEVMGMPSERRTKTERRCWEIANQVEKSFPDFLADNTIRDLRDVHKLGDWFRSLRLSCPFLADDLCTIYDSRPGTCREWLTTGTALDCLASSAVNNRHLRTTGSMTVSLAQLTAKLQHARQEIVPLYLIFKCRQENMDLLSRAWPSTYLIDEYLQTVVTLQERNTKSPSAYVSPPES